jgi:hypothetical protein
MDRHGSALAELRPPYRDHLLLPVDVVPVEAHRLPRAHAGGGDEPDEGLVGGSSQRRAQGPGGRHQRRDIGVGVQVGVDTAGPEGQQVTRWDLGVRIESLQIAGEPAHQGQAPGPPNRGAARRLGGPGQCQLGGDRRGASRFQVGDELRKLDAVIDVLAPQRAVQAEIVIEGLVESGDHAGSPGHGVASWRSATKSTFA